jgi:hypothetical protein
MLNQFLKRLSCLFNFHSWKCIDVMPYTDSSYDEKVPSVSYTRICRRCGAIQYDSIWGCDNIDKESLSTPE